MSKSICLLIHRHCCFVALGLSLVVLLHTLGCTSLRYAGAPPPSYNIDEDLKQLAEHFKPATAVSNYYALAIPTPKDRNAVISARLVMINLEYLKWLRTVTAEKQFLDTAADVLIMSLNLAATVAGGETTKTVLAAISAGIAGSKASIDKHYFYEKTVPALIAAMNAQRKDVLARILENMKKNLEEYSFEQALANVYEYYQAGTFMGAIAAIQVDSGAKEKKADEEIKQLVKLVPFTPENVKAKAALTNAIATLGESDLDKIKTAVKKIDPEVTPESNLDAAKAQLQKYVREARTPDDIAKLTKAFEDTGIPLTK